jgi:uncharacterized protein Yka (UPF0111/DUF47 family)
MGIMANLVPREGKFFEYFNQHADRIAEASRELTLLLSEYSNEPARAGRVERINDLEHEADRITHDTALRCCRPSSSRRWTATTSTG